MRHEPSDVVAHRADTRRVAHATTATPPARHPAGARRPRYALVAAAVLLASVGATTTPPAGAAEKASTAATTTTETLTPDDVLAYARSHRAEIVVARERAKASAESARVVSAPSDPMLMISIDHLPIMLDGLNASLMIQQEFPLGGTLGARGRVAEAEARAATADADRTKLDVEYQALAAFLMLAELQRTTTIVDEQRELAQQVLVAARARVAISSGVLGDLVRAELDVERLAGERKSLDAEVRSASGMLDASLGRPTRADVPMCVLSVPATEPPAATTLVAKALELRPELHAMRARVAKADAELDVMKSMYTPMAFVRAGGAYTMYDKWGAMLMVGVSLPIWRDKLEGGVAEARAMRSMADADVEAMRTMIEGEVTSAREAVVAARIRLDTAHEKLVPLAKQSIALSLTSYGLGQTPLVGVLEAERTYREIRMEETASEVKLAAAWARLGRAVGVVRVGAP